MAQSTPVITLKQDFDPDELPMVCLQQDYDDATKEKMEVPVIARYWAKSQKALLQKPALSFSYNLV
jgi:hypothetical protein